MTKLNEYGLTPNEEEGRVRLQNFIDCALILHAEGWTEDELHNELHYYLKSKSNVEHIEDHRQLELPLGVV